MTKLLAEVVKLGGKPKQALYPRQNQEDNKNQN